MEEKLRNEIKQKKEILKTDAHPEIIRLVKQADYTKDMINVFATILDTLQQYDEEYVIAVADAVVEQLNKVELQINTIVDNINEALKELDSEY